jgi:ATP-dependent DNA helicase RecG
LGNEANIRGFKEAWLIFGITNDKRIVGSAYRKDGSLHNLKKEIAGGTNERATFMEIYEVRIDSFRIVAMQIPPATRGIPTTWNGAAYARKLFIKKQNSTKKSTEMLLKVSDVEMLNKAGILIKGKITNTALILLGKESSSYLFDGFIPRITWTLYNGNGSVKAYEHFDMPLLLAVDKAYAKIRNEKYRYIAGQQTLFPDETYQYEADVVKEILNNCIAHSNYQLRGKINLEEFEDRLVFINEGAFSSLLPPAGESVSSQDQNSFQISGSFSRRFCFLSSAGRSL